MATLHRLTPQMVLWLLLLFLLLGGAESLWMAAGFTTLISLTSLYILSDRVASWFRPKMIVVPDMEQIRRKNSNGHDDFYPPLYGTSDSCGMDVAIQYPLIIRVNSVVTIDLCFAARVPHRHGAFILPRSGKGSKEGIGLRNTLALIDSDYTGNWKATITRDQWESIVSDNFNQLEKYVVKKADDSLEYHIPAGEYLFQVAILPYTKVKPTVDENYCLGKTERGTGGHGSTTKKEIKVGNLQGASEMRDFVNVDDDSKCSDELPSIMKSATSPTSRHHRANLPCDPKPGESWEIKD